MKRQIVTLSILAGHERHSWINPWLLNSLFRSLNDEKYLVKVGITHDIKPVECARIACVQTAQRDGAGWLCMIDNDICPQVDFLRSLDHADEHSADVIIQPSFLFQGLDTKPRPSLNLKQPASGGLVEIEGGGFGCVFIRMALFEKLEQPWFRSVLKNDFQLGRDSIGYELSEDFEFCQRASAAGFRIFADMDRSVEHFHTMPLRSVRQRILSGDAIK